MLETPFRKLQDPALRGIADKLQAGERLNRDDGLAAFASHDLIGVGRLANSVKEQRSGPYAFFVLNRQINPTNICVLSCKFCDFAAKAGDDDAYEMTMAEIVDKVREPIHEVHIVGGLHPTWPFEYYEEMLRAIKRASPAIQIKAFTAVEIDFFSRLAKISIDEVLERLQAAGLDTMPGGGSEVFSERVRRELYRQKMGADRWLEIHRAAHRRGIRTNATLLYGHIETHQERVDHMLLLRDLQDDTGGFFSFIPLAFQLGYTNIVERPASALEDLKTIAVARLLLDNFSHIKAYWVMLGEETASMALQWGADDLDGTIGEERIAHAALASSPLGLTVHSMLKLVREAGRVPVQRDARYRALTLYPSPPPPI
ncbi:MAG: aminofutalosine synthase MqnE, partial [Acidobacteriota bacterium]